LQSRVLELEEVLQEGLSPAWLVGLGLLFALPLVLLLVEHLQHSALVWFGSEFIMKILTDTELSIKVAGGAAEIQSQKSEVYINEKPTNVYVTGVMLEASIKWNEFYLLFTTDDIPQEDMLHVHLLDAELQLIDSLTIGSRYSTGSFRSLEIIEPNMVVFHFIGGTQWKIEISSKKNFFVPYISEPKGVYHKLRFSRFLKITGKPSPEEV